MYYEITVSKNGKHLFATSERSITNTDKVTEIFNLFKEKFPENEGYKLEATFWKKTGTKINIIDT